MLPAPGLEFGLVRAAARLGDVDLAVLAVEAEGKPLLGLAAVAAAPGLAGDDRWQVVGEPFGRLGEQGRRADIGFFVELARRGGERRLAGIDAALRHLPGMRAVDMFGSGTAALAGEDETVTVDQHHPDTGAVGQVFEAGHGAVRSMLTAS